MHKTFIVTTLAAVVGAGNVSTPLLPGAAPAVAQEHKHGPGETHRLGRKMIGDYNVSVVLIGEVEAGKQVDFDIKLIDAKTEPKALRVWIGTEDAKGSTKAEGKKGAATYTGKISIPNPPPEGSKLWVELETDTGVKSAGYNLEEHGHQH